MSAAIENFAICQVCDMIRFLMTKDLSAAGIHCELCIVYSQTLMSKGVVHLWIHLFKSGKINIHIEERNGRPSVVGDEHVQKIEKVCENKLFSLSEHLE